MPNTGLGALENHVDQAQGTIGIESADAVEPDVAHNLWPSANLAVD
jgi:hypothetical protein